MWTSWSVKVYNWLFREYFHSSFNNNKVNSIKWTSKHVSITVWQSYKIQLLFNNKFNICLHHPHWVQCKLYCICLNATCTHIFHIFAKQLRQYYSHIGMSHEITFILVPVKLLLHGISLKLLYCKKKKKSSKLFYFSKYQIN